MEEVKHGFDSKYDIIMEHNDVNGTFRLRHMITGLYLCYCPGNPVKDRKCSCILLRESNGCKPGVRGYIRPRVPHMQYLFFSRLPEDVSLTQIGVDFPYPSDGRDGKRIPHNCIYSEELPYEWLDRLKARMGHCARRSTSAFNPFNGNTYIELVSNDKDTIRDEEQSIVRLHYVTGAQFDFSDGSEYKKVQYPSVSRRSNPTAALDLLHKRFDRMHF